MRMSVAPEGLPARELTQDRAEGQRPELTPVQPANNGRDHNDTAALHALSE